MTFFSLEDKIQQAGGNPATTMLRAPPAPPSTPLPRSRSADGATDAMTSREVAAVTLTADTGIPADEGRTGDEGRLIVHGQDRPGVVAGVSAALTAAGANIVSLDQYSTDPV